MGFVQKSPVHDGPNTAGMLSVMFVHCALKTHTCDE